MKYAMSILVLLIMSYSAPIFGQHIVAIRWGGNMTKIGGFDHHGAPRRSMRIGASVTVPIQNRFSLQAHGDYVPKGAGEDDFYYYTGLYIDYIELSGLGAFTVFAPSRGSSLSMSILAGPTIAFKIKNRGEEILAKRYGQGQDRFDFKSIDFGFAGGIGTQIAIFKPWIVTTEILYTRSIQSINKTTFYIVDYDSHTAEKRGLMNHALSFSIGLGFSYGRRTGG
ncbi:MAG: hypothetical protein F4X51_11580 [Gemmatimonadetes bacterium]|nr:hypothetical protein [Gemmatimonadota bacterium]